MKLLIVDDNMAVRTTLKLLLVPEFGEVVAVGDPTLIPALLKGGNVDAVILDMNFDSTKLDCSDGLFWLSRIKESPEAPAVVVITAFGDLEKAVEAMKRGAEDFVTKPWNNEALVEKIRRAIAVNRRRRQETGAAHRVELMEKTLHERDNMTLDEVKIRHIRNVIERCGGNLSVASEQLGISRQTLYNLIKKPI